MCKAPRLGDTNNKFSIIFTWFGKKWEFLTLSLFIQITVLIITLSHIKCKQYSYNLLYILNF